MSNKQRLILGLVIILSGIFGFDYITEVSRTTTKDTEDVRLKYAEFNNNYFNFINQDPLSRMSRLSKNMVLPIGEFVVGEENDALDHTIEEGWYIIKNEDYNDRASFSLNGNDYILFPLSRSSVQANYVEIYLKNGDEIKTNNRLVLKATRTLE